LDRKDRSDGASRFSRYARSWNVLGSSTSCPSGRDLRRFRFSGRIAIVQITIFPGFAGHGPP
jgi:hypothetical protein